MSQRQRQQFGQRLKRIERIHRRGGGFEAAGALGQAYYTRLQRKGKRPVLRPALAIVAGIVMLKALSAASLPPGDYEARVAALAEGGFAQRAGAFVMAPDPISRQLAAWMAPAFAAAETQAP